MTSRNMTALLAMLAMVGWQNRDKLGELLGAVTGQRPTGPSPEQIRELAPQARTPEDSVVCWVDCSVGAVVVRQCPVDWATC